MAAAVAPLVQLEGSIADVLMPITSGESDFGGIGVSEDVSETVVSHTAVEGLMVKESLTVEDALERVDVGKILTPIVRYLWFVVCEELLLNVFWIILDEWRVSGVVDAVDAGR